ncbi:helix-turn-helix domain-containing protein [Streptomyces kaempferi]
MPRWKALPDELDPQVKEFAVQLRRLVDRSGLGIAALADRTGYSRTSWERYLNGGSSRRRARSSPWPR